jgi:LysM repeat protein
MDKITQLQTQLAIMTSLMVDSVGRLQNVAPPIAINESTPITASTTEQSLTAEETIQEATRYGKEFVQACQEFERLLDELPNVNVGEQNDKLSQLNTNNKQQANELNDFTLQANDLLERISGALKEIANHRFHKDTPLQ